mmetsp:Transcript_80149/g.206284  ORF Transcript_80149/g.206284 Transcript_80149/m.206284 type:complete len:230 (-) Transcript_80149:441-1130(-)
MGGAVCTRLRSGGPPTDKAKGRHARSCRPERRHILQHYMFFALARQLSLEHACPTRAGPRCVKSNIRMLAPFKHSDKVDAAALSATRSRSRRAATLGAAAVPAWNPGKPTPMAWHTRRRGLGAGFLGLLLEPRICLGLLRRVGLALAALRRRGRGRGVGLALALGLVGLVGLLVGPIGLGLGGLVCRHVLVVLRLQGLVPLLVLGLLLVADFLPCRGGQLRAGAEGRVA